MGTLTGQKERLRRISAEVINDNRSQEDNDYERRAKSVPWLTEGVLKCAEIDLRESEEILWTYATISILTEVCGWNGSLIERYALYSSLRDDQPQELTDFLELRIDDELERIAQQEDQNELLYFASIWPE